MALARAIYDYPEPNEQGGTKVFLLDGPFASTDPRVGSNIFKKLFGLNGLIKNAAVILTIDEVNLRFLLNSMEQLNIQLSINLKTRIMDKGMLSEIEGPSIYRIEEPISQSQLPQTKLQEKALPWESESIKQSHEEKSSFIEQAYSGVVGHETYKYTVDIQNDCVNFSILVIQVVFTLCWLWCIVIDGNSHHRNASHRNWIRFLVCY